MPIVTVQLFEGRSADQKRALARAITEVVVEHAKTQPEAVEVIFVDVKKSDWATAGVLASDK